MRTAGIVLCVVFTASVFGFAEWCAVKGIAAAFGGPAEPPLEFYKLDSEKIVVYRGDKNEVSVPNTYLYTQMLEHMADLSADVSKDATAADVSKTRITSKAGVQNNRIDAKDAAGAFAPVE